MAITRTIPVNLGRRSYQVFVGQALLGELAQLLSAVLEGWSKVVIITDSNVGPLYARAAAESLNRSSLRCEVLEFPAGEASKNLATYVELINRLLAPAPAIDRHALILALGGGVVGDLAGFVAATALRGLDFVQLPTTLLAAVDASVGGKTGLDTPAGKNLVGAFHQPKAVVIDAELLATLPAAELGSGLAECVKHAVIRQPAMLERLRRRAGEILSANPAALAELIADNVAIKAAIVSSDERESGERAHLNFGHTVAHAIETAAGYSAVAHGQAVSLGMVAACRIAANRKLLSPADELLVREVLAALHLPMRWLDLPELPASAKDAANLRKIMLHDKKAQAGVVRFVLPLGLGRCGIFDDVSDREIDAALGALK